MRDVALYIAVNLPNENFRYLQIFAMFLAKHFYGYVWELRNNRRLWTFNGGRNGGGISVNVFAI